MYAEEKMQSPRSEKDEDSWDEMMAFDSSSDKGWNSESDRAGDEGSTAHDSSDIVEGNQDENDSEPSREELVAEALPGSGFEFTSAATQSRLNISKYIPLGCLRIRRTYWSISFDYWMSCKSQWRAFNHPKDGPGPDSGNYLSPIFQDNIFQEADLKPCRALHDAAWIRMEFRSNHRNWGIARVYVLPDDFGRAEVDRKQPSLHKAMNTLLSTLHISKSAWNGQWCEADPRITIYSSLLEKESEAPSLFQLFNTLQSPDPKPEIVSDPYVQDAMYAILSNEVGGLTTKLYTYQQKSASYMLQRENAPSQILDPRLKNFTDQHDKTWYCDLSIGNCFREPRFYEAARGGICAETMGLGKTLICLAVILSTKELSSKIPSEILGTLPARKKTGSLLEMAASTLTRTGTPWKSQLAQIEAMEGYELTRVRQALKEHTGYYLLHPPPPRRVSRNPAVVVPRKIYLSSTTIVVVLPNLVQQWLREIEKHTKPGSLNLLLMDDWKQDLPSSEELLVYDVILFSKPRFEYEARDEQTAEDEDENVKMGRYNIKRHGKGNTAYHSPLRDVHFKRLIIDEGHTFGNASKTSKTEAVTVVDFLHLSSRWIISGTPTRGLYGLEVISGKSSKAKSSKSQQFLGSPSEDGPQFAKIFASETSSANSTASLSKIQLEKFYTQERKDIEKLGNIATMFLKIRPWANSQEAEDTASWSQYVMQPRHGSKSQGNTECLRTTLEGMIVRHRPEDVIKDVTLPPLQQDFVYLDGSLQNKLTLNTFVMMIITNAVTSERKDADYFFHYRQRKSLQSLVSNLRQGSFFWSGFETEHIQSTVENARKFLEEKKVPVTPEDEALLLEAIKIGEIVLSNNISQFIRKTHEMPMYIENELADEVRKAWALDGNARNPTLMGATLVHGAQKFIESQLFRSDPMEGLVAAGTKAMAAALESQDSKAVAPPKTPKQRDALKRKRAAESAPELAGGVTVGNASSPRKKTKASVSASRKSAVSSDLLIDASPPAPKKPAVSPDLLTDPSQFSSSNSTDKESQTAEDQLNGGLLTSISTLKPALKQSSKPDIAGTLDPNSPIASASIVSTASVKLSYLMDRIVKHQATEKIIVFYESDNVAYYIAQALECLGIKHLIYAKSLHSSRRSKYIVTFNQTENFRVLLMDVSQAAFGLDLSSASRVYFVNPVFSPQVEAQAVKRAHRIGQTKPVYVETLVLKGSIEEVILERRKDMSEQEHNKCKSILDDQMMYDWVRNVRFLPMPDKEVPGPEQMAVLETKQKVFSSGTFGGKELDPDEGLIEDGKLETMDKSKKGKGKRKAKVAFAEKPVEESSTPKRAHFSPPPRTNGDDPGVGRSSSS